MRLKSCLRLSRRLEYKSPRVNRSNSYESMRVHERDNNIYTFKIKLRINVEAQWAEPMSLTSQFVLKKLYTEPSIGGAYQISINLAKWF